MLHNITYKRYRHWLYRRSYRFRYDIIAANIEIFYNNHRSIDLPTTNNVNSIKNTQMSIQDQMEVNLQTISPRSMDQRVVPKTLTADSLVKAVET
jgi:hypothetical protein